MAVLLGFLSAGRKILKTLGIALASISGPCILFFTYLALCSWQITPPRKLRLHQDQAQQLRNLLKSEKKDGELEKLSKQIDFLLRVPLDGLKPECSEYYSPIEERLLMSKQDKEAFEPPHIILLSSSPAEDPLFVPDFVLNFKKAYIDSYSVGGSIHKSEKEPVVLIVGNMWDSRGLVFLIMIAAVLAINLRFLNINYTSPHGFYRDQLSRVFLVKEHKGLLTWADALKLSQLRERQGGGASCAPYHLINATINLGNDMRHNLRSRKAGFFLFSKHFVGSQETGWCETARMEKAAPHLDLGTAMAISGAAASPNMGAFTSRAFSFLMMLLNIRLGYWLPNPARVRKPHRPFWVPGPRYLLKEALGLFDTQGRYVNVSDGGHLENLGVYELLRRRCRLIIAVDGEADPQLRFNSLVTLSRFAHIDLGISIDIDLEQLRQTGGRSKVHWVQATIHYGEGETGTLLYIKSTLTGDESPSIHSYREAHPAFPHESTANQFFTETQFEVYRALGEHIAGKIPLEELMRHFQIAAPAQPGQPAADNQASSAVA
jgi:hypothetical protein